jgi:hypothetical protein
MELGRKNTEREATVSVFLTVSSSREDEGVAGRNSSNPRGTGG